MTKTMAVTFYMAALAALGMGTSGTRALAQDAAPAPKPITIKLGAFLPSGSVLKNAGNTWFSAGAEYAVLPQASTEGSPASLVPLGYVDYAQGSRHGLRADYVGVGPGVRFYGAAPGSGPLTPYVGAGIGAYFLHASGNGDSFNKTQFGFKLDAGVEFNRAYVFEINYTDAGSADGARFDGFNLQAGVKF